METIADRILSIVSNKEKGNKRQFALKVEINPSYVSQMDKNRDMIPSTRILDKICMVYGVSRKWIETGEGDPFPPKSLGDEMGEIAAEASKQNVEAVRKFFRELGDEFTDAEILFLYEIYKKHFGKAEQPTKIYPFGQKNTAAARSGDRAQAAEVSAQEEEEALSPPDSSAI